MFFKVVHQKEVHIFNPKDKASYASLITYIKDVFRHLPAKFQLCYIDEQNDEITLANDNDFKIMYQTANKTVKIFIKEVSENFYDETQKVVLDDEMDYIEDKINQIRLDSVQENSQPEEIIQPEESEVSMFAESQASYISDASIQEKFKELMPEFIGKVKEQLLKESTQQSEIKFSKIHEKVQHKTQTRVVHQYVTCDECKQTNIQGVRYKCAVCPDFDLCENCEVISEHSHPFLKIKTPKQAPYKLIAIINDQEQNSFQVNGQKVNFQNFPFGRNIMDAFCGPRGRGSRCHRGQRQQQGSNGRCPYKWGRKCEKKAQKQEQKVEKLSECEKKVKVQEKFEEKDTQPIIVEERKQQTKPIIQQKTQIKVSPVISEQEKLMSVAIYLSDILDIDYNRCYKFAKANNSLSQQQLLELYFVNPRLL